MLRRFRGRTAGDEAPTEPAAPAQPAQPAPPAASPNTPNTPKPEYAALGPDAPIAWPSGARRVPVTGQLSDHAAAALERMGVTTPKE